MFALTRAGWRPVPHVRASSEQLWIERFGERGGAQLLTVYNPTDAPISTSMVLNRVNMGYGKQSMRVRRFDDASELGGAPEEGKHRTAVFRVPAYSTIVFSVSPG